MKLPASMFGTAICWSVTLSGCTTDPGGSSIGQTAGTSAASPMPTAGGGGGSSSGGSPATTGSGGLVIDVPPPPSMAGTDTGRTPIKLTNLTPTEVGGY